MTRLQALLAGVHATLAAVEERGADEFTSQHVKLAKANVEEALFELANAPQASPAAAQDLEALCAQIRERIMEGVAQIPEPIKRAIAGAVIQALEPYRGEG